MYEFLNPSIHVLWPANLNECGLHQRLGTLVDTGCEHGKPLGAIKGYENLDQLGDHQLLKYDAVPRSERITN